MLLLLLDTTVEVLTNLSLLFIILPQNGITQHIERKFTLIVGIGTLLINIDDTGLVVDGGNEGITLHSRLLDTLRKQLIGMLHIPLGLLLGTDTSIIQNLVTCLIQNIGTTKTYQEHLQKRILNEQSGEDGTERQEIILQVQVLGLTRQHANKHVGKHGKDVTEVLSDISPACKRKKSDQVTDLDTGEIQGGELLLRRANRAETAVYLASEKAGKKKKEMLSNPLQQMLKGKGNTYVVVMNMNDEFGN